MVVGCGDDDNGTGGSGGTAGTGGSGGGGTELSIEVSWAPALPLECEQGTPSEYLVEIAPTNQVGEVTITGSVSSCSPGLTTELNEIECPNNAPYPATVTVTDEGGGSVTVQFTVEVCGEGSVTGP